MDAYTMQQSSSFVHIRNAGANAPLREALLRIDSEPDHVLLARMVREMPECQSMLELIGERLCTEVSALATAAGLTRPDLVDVLAYLIVYGLVPFRIERGAGGGKGAVPVVIPSHRVQWSSSVFSVVEGDRFPRISAEHAGRERVQGYVYFYRFSQALSSVQSLFRRVLPAYRELLAVREYNTLVRRQNVTRTLLVNRGVPPPDRSLQFQEINKPDIFDDSIMQVATKLAVDTTDVTIGQDTKQVKFVQGCVQTQMQREEEVDPQYEKTLVLPPLCSTHVDRQSAVEISEASYMERFHRAIALVFNLPEHGHLRQDASTSKTQGTAAPGRNSGMAPPKTTWDRYLDLKFIMGDMQECLAIMCALARDTEYQKNMLIAIERERADRRARYRSEGTLFPVQMIAPPEVPDVIVKTASVGSFVQLLALYEKGYLRFEDFAKVFKDTVGYDLAPPPESDEMPGSRSEEGNAKQGAKKSTGKHGHDKHGKDKESGSDDDDSARKDAKKSAHKHGKHGKHGDSGSDDDDDAKKHAKKSAHKHKHKHKHGNDGDSGSDDNDDNAKKHAKKSAHKHGKHGDSGSDDDDDAKKHAKKSAHKHKHKHGNDGDSGSDDNDDDDAKKHAKKSPHKHDNAHATASDGDDKKSSTDRHSKKKKRSHSDGNESSSSSSTDGDSAARKKKKIKHKSTKQKKASGSKDIKEIVREAPHVSTGDTLPR